MPSMYVFVSFRWFACAQSKASRCHQEEENVSHNTHLERINLHDGNE